MDYGSTLDLKLVRFLHEACAKLARNWAEKLSLASLLLIVNFHPCFPTGWLERRNYMRQPMVQIQIRCRIATHTYKKHLQRNNIRYPTTISLAQNLGPALRETCGCRF